MDTFVAQWIWDSIEAVGKDETVELLWDEYLSASPVADPSIARALAMLDPHWVA